MTIGEKFLDEKIKEIAKEKIIRDVGGGAPFQKGFVKYREYFKNSDYKTLDYNPDCHPDIIGDIHNLPFKDESIDAIICKSVLEHVYDPHKAVSEIRRVLKRGGKCFINGPFLYPYHGNETHKDYYRYTQDGIKYLFRDFKTIEVCSAGGYGKILRSFLPYPDKFPISILSYLTRFLDKISEKHQSKRQVAGYYVFLIK